MKILIFKKYLFILHIIMFLKLSTFFYSFFFFSCRSTYKRKVHNTRVKDCICSCAKYVRWPQGEKKRLCWWERINNNFFSVLFWRIATLLKWNEKEKNEMIFFFIVYMWGKHRLMMSITLSAFDRVFEKENWEFEHFTLKTLS